MANPCTYVLTGQDGSVWFKPAGTSLCLKDHSSFWEGEAILVPPTHDLRYGDPIIFRAGEGSPTLDSAYSLGPVYYVKQVGTATVMGKTLHYIVVGETLTGPDIYPVGDGGIAGSDTPNAHVQIEYADYLAVAEVADFMIAITRDKLDTTSLPKGAEGSSKYAGFRSGQSGYSAGTGNLKVRFSRDQKGLVSRLTEGVLLKVQEGAGIKLYISTISDDNLSDPRPDDFESSYFDAPITIESFDAKVDPQSATEGTITFSIAGTPDQMLSASAPPVIFGVTPATIP